MALMDTVEQVLAEDEWVYEELSEPGLLGLRCAAENGEWPVFVFVADDLITVESTLPQVVPKRRRQEVMELVTRINFASRVCTLQFDLPTGEIRMHSGLVVEVGELTPNMFRTLLYGNIGAMDHCFDAIMAVSFAKVDALSALLEHENRIVSEEAP